MKTKLFLGAILTVIVVGGNLFAATKPKKITIEEAQTIALKRISGTVESSLAEKKDYLFVIRGDDGIKRDVYVSDNGKVKKFVVDAR